MPILNTGDTTTPVTEHQYRTQQELQTTTLFNKETPIEKITQQVSGMRWTVDYFNQIIGVNGQPTNPDTNIPSTTLKYNRVDKLDIYLDSGLPEGTALDVVGNGTINAGFVPYIGDAFKATVAGGREAIFVLTNVTKNYYNTHDIYLVEFKLTYFLDTSVTIYNDLVYKTIRTYVYDKDFISKSGAPLILASEYSARLNLERQPSIIGKYYVDTFLDKNINRFKLPAGISTYVDQLVNSFIFELLSVNDVPDLINITNDPVDIKDITIWDVLKRRDITLLKLANRNMTYGINRDMSATRKTSSYLGISYTIMVNPVIPAPSPIMINNPVLDNNPVIDAVINNDGTYIFSNDFYNQTTGVTYTTLETAVMDYLNNKVPLMSDIEKLVSEYRYWTYEHQYTLLPVLVLLIKTLINNNYSAV